MTPSVSLKVDIPEDMNGNFYRGFVFVGQKENAFQPSSYLHHLQELNAISPPEKPIECHYHDGGPDHNIRHMHNKLANIAYFLHRNLDLLCSLQTPPYHSWKNPCEGCMSLLYIGLQGVGIMRQEIESCESYLKNANNLSEKRKIKAKHPKIVDEVSNAVKPTKELMDTIFRKLSLRGSIDAASDEDISKFCDVHNQQEPFKKITIDLILLNATTIRPNSKIRKILNEAKKLTKVCKLKITPVHHI